MGAGLELMVDSLQRRERDVGEEGRVPSGLASGVHGANDGVVLGAGIGPALLQACFELARSEAYPAMFLGVWEHNPRAQAFYRKWGFEKVGEHLFQLGDDPQTDWWMYRAL